MYMSLSDYPYLFSWIAGGVVLFGVGSAMLIFVDRVLSLVILYIAAPISISTSTIDDGARFKLWRDQFLSKFIMGYGMILAINIYAMVCGLVTRPGFAFFPGEGMDMKFLDLIMKLLIMAGGALTMQKSMAIIGNLVSSGAGSNELRDNAFSMGGLARMAGGVAGKALGFATGVASLPLKPVGGIISNAYGMQIRHLGGKLLTSMGLEGGGGAKDKDKSKDSEGKSGATNNAKADYGSNDTAKNAINDDGGFKTSFSGNSNNNNNTQQGEKSNPVGNAINGGGKNDQKGENK
jgi:hypothetical protein